MVVLVVVVTMVLETKVKCDRCGYVWVYRGGMFFATCPRCYKKVDIRKNRVNGDV
jgi:uncharacterized C2H2 Zn-finger protein